MAKFERRVDINAPMETVWNILSDASTWATWFPDADAVTGLASVAAGSTFQYQDNGKTGTAVIDKVDTEHWLIRVTTRMDDREETHTFDLDKKGGFFGGNDSKLLYSLEYNAGGVLGEFIKGDNPMDTQQVKNTLGRLKSLAERRA